MTETPTYSLDNLPTDAAERRNYLVNAFQPFVASIARRLWKSLPIRVEFDDLVSQGQIGLLQAADRYDAERGKFVSYVKHRIRGAMLDWLREQDPATRDGRKAIKTYDESLAVLKAKLGRKPTDEEHAAYLDLTVEEFLHLRDASRTVRTVVSLSEKTYRDGQPLKERATTDPDEQPDTQAVRKKVCVVIDACAMDLSPRHRQILTAYYRDGKTMQEIGDSQPRPVNESRISQLHAAAIEQMREAMARRGYRDLRQLL